jgi:methyl-accepting chemotaxis protein
MIQPSRASIIKKLLLLYLVIIMGILSFLGFFYQSFSTNLRLEKKAQAKQLSEVGMSVIKYFHQRALIGELTEKQAKHCALNSLQNVRYGKNGYYWMNNGKGILIMQPFEKQRVGKDLTDWTDINKKYIFREFVEIAKNGGGWVDYFWPKPKSEKPYSKVSYVSYYSPWDWVLGNGLYLDDMEKDIHNTLIQASSILLVCFLVFIMITSFLANIFINQLDDLAIMDNLTGLYKKIFLKEMIPIILKKNIRNKDELLIAVFLDIDHFKKVNDTYGHTMGDQVLALVGKTMRENSRPDDLCVRYGGEEFVIVGFYDSKESILKVVERIRTVISELSFKKRNKEFSITISAGIAIHQDNEEIFDNTLKIADENLYRAKNKGRNCVVF